MPAHNSCPAHRIGKEGDDYAGAGIAEYGIVDPLQEHISALRLEHDAYVEHGVFGRGDGATSALLEGFAVSVDVVFDAA